VPVAFATPLAATSAGGSALWYLSRGTGVVVLVLLTIVVALGVLTRRGASPRGFTFVAGEVHRNASLLAMAFLGVHIVTAVIDPNAPIRWVDAIVPFGCAYRPVWLGLGALAFDLLVALVVTSLLRLRLGLRWWKRVHWLAYLSWPAAVLHGAGTGSDTRTSWDLSLVTVCVATVVAAVFVRAGTLRSRSPLHSTLVRATALAGALAFGGWMIVGPLAPGWSARAGTPKPAPGVSTAALP
jgi:sulfoxide reductase heme-binding subunit YedZ